ncbi:MAG: hypothetical protein R2796_07275 [Chitinophagaceae bacterium]|nr:hypothetical protein [Chitinophagaceae bacterium]
MKLKFFTILCISFTFLACQSEKTTNDETALAAMQKTSHENFNALKNSDLGQIGEYFIGMQATDVLQKLGKPSSQSKTAVWPADNWTHQDWEYPEQGIRFNMIQENADTNFQIFSITISSPATIKTKKQIGIGSTYEEVMQAYQNEIDPAASSAKLVVVGSLNGGLLIYLHNHQVIRLSSGTSTT